MANDLTHFDSTLFTSDIELLKGFPNPYLSEVQAKGVEGWTNGTWDWHTVTLSATSTATTSPAKRTSLARRWDRH